MRRTLMIAAALAFVGIAPHALAQKLDHNGRCHGPDGKFAKAEVCKGGPAMMEHKYKLDLKGHCHDERGRMAKKEFCKA